MPNFEVDFYKKENGECPVQDFLDSLDSKMRAKLLVGFALLEANGPQLREPYSKHIGDGIFEIRAKQGSNITRVLYFFFVGRQIVLTNGFTKKTRKRRPPNWPPPKSTAPHISNERGLSDERFSQLSQPAAEGPRL